MVRQAFIKISKKGKCITKEELEALKKMLDEEGLEYYVVRDIEK